MYTSRQNLQIQEMSWRTCQALYVPVSDHSNCTSAWSAPLLLHYGWESEIPKALTSVPGDSFSYLNTHKDVPAYCN